MTYIVKILEMLFRRQLKVYPVLLKQSHIRQENASGAPVKGFTGSSQSFLPFFLFFFFNITKHKMLRVILGKISVNRNFYLY